MLSGVAIGGLTLFLIARKHAAAVSTTLTASTGTSSGAQSPADSQPAPVVVQRVSNWPEGTLLRHGNNEKVYVIDAKGYRHWISNRMAFDSSGYKMSDVKVITLNQMIAIPESTPLSGMNGLGNGLLM